MKGFPKKRRFTLCIVDNILSVVSNRKLKSNLLKKIKRIYWLLEHKNSEVGLVSEKDCSCST